MACSAKNWTSSSLSDIKPDIHNLDYFLTPSGNCPITYVNVFNKAIFTFATLSFDNSFPTFENNYPNYFYFIVDLNLQNADAALTLYI